jgi:hypothetical protein
VIVRLAAVVLLFCASARAWDLTPVGGVTALGGLHTFAGDAGSFSGNLDATFSPAVRFDERRALLPSVRVIFEGTRRLNDVLGTATAAQQRTEARVGLRGVYGDPASRWRFKPALSYGAEFLKETRDERWGQGLFDSRRLAVGGEAEYLTDAPRSVRISAGWFSVQYPNYTTLESQAALQFQGQSLARELVGDHALDREGYQFALSGDAALGARFVGEAKTSVVWSQFPNQRVVDEGGQFKSDNRQDVAFDAAFTARMPHAWNADLRAFAAFEFGLGANTSNQNGYDATRGRFLSGFYDFIEFRAVPSASLIVGPPRRPVTTTLTLGWRRRDYVHRPAQDATGVYTGSSLSTTQWSFGVGASYPMSGRLSLVAQLERASASSNQGFSPFYRYAYEATTALAGVRFTW